MRFSSVCIVCGKEAQKITKSDVPLFRCPGCGLLWLWDDTIAGDFYDDLSIDTGAGITARRLRDCRNRVKTFERYGPLDHLCDVGTNDGTFLRTLKDEGYEHCFGIEPNRRGVEAAVAAGVDVVRGSVDQLVRLCGDRDVRTVSFLQVLEHLRDPAAALDQARQVLPAGGCLIIETVNADASMVCVQGAYISQYHRFYFTEKNLRLLLQKHGFRLFGWYRVIVGAVLLALVLTGYLK